MEAARIQQAAMRELQSSAERLSDTEMQSTSKKRKLLPGSQPPVRVSRACDQCRSKKYKCDGSQPCSPCSNAKQTCSYDPRFRKRGLTEGYVRGLERLLGMAISSDPNFEAIVMSIVKNAQDKLQTILSPPGGWAIDREDETLLESWKKSGIAQEMEGLIPTLELLEGTRWKKRQSNVEATRPIRHEEAGCENGAMAPSDDVPRSSVDGMVELSGLPSIDAPGKQSQDPACLDTRSNIVGNEYVGVGQNSPSRTIGGLVSKPLHDFFTVGVPVQLQQAPVTEQSNVSIYLQSRSSLPQTLPNRAGDLLDLYFTWTHCWFPIVERHDMMKLSHRYSQNFRRISADSSGGGDFAALWAILAYAESYAEGSIHGKRVETTYNPNEELQNFYEIARALVPAENVTFEIGHVQALLILALYNSRHALWSRAWILLGQAIRIAVDLGFDKPNVCAGSEIRSKNTARHTHVFLGCFLIDTLLSARLGRKPYLRNDSMKGLGLLEEEGTEEWDSWNYPHEVGRNETHQGPRSPSFILSTFNRLIEVAGILNDILCDDLGQIKSQVQSNDLYYRLSKVMAICNETYPPTWISKPIPHQALLHLVYCSTLAEIPSLTTLKTTSSPFDGRDKLIAEELVSQLQRCCKAFNAYQLPPPAELSFFFALRELKNVSTLQLAEYSTYQDLEKKLLMIAHDASGAAFRVMEENTRNLKFINKGQQVDTSLDGMNVCHKYQQADESNTNPRQVSNWESAQAFIRKRFTPQVAQTTSIYPADPTHSLQSDDVSHGSGIAKAMPEVVLPIDRGSVGSKPSTVGKKFYEIPNLLDDSLRSTGTGFTPAGPIAASDGPLSDADAAFFGLAHLDTTEWSLYPLQYSGLPLTTTTGPLTGIISFLTWDSWITPRSAISVTTTKE